MNEITVDYLLNEANSKQTFFTLFVQSYKKDTNTLYCFYEGKDDTKYYRIRIENISENSNIEWFHCEGKDNVIGAYEMIKKLDDYYDLNRLLFFVDKDFSTHIKNEDIYCTPYYSIENFYTQREVVEKIFQDEFKLIKNSSENDDYNTALQIYDELLLKFHTEILFLNAWLACQNDKRIMKAEKRRLNIDDKLKSYFSNIVYDDLINISDFTDLKNIESLKNIFPDAYDISETEINDKLEEFRNKDGTKFFRGKFELKFLVSFLKRIKEELGKRNSKIFSKRYSGINIQIDFPSAMSSLTQYAITPNCLRKYLEKHKNAA